MKRLLILGLLLLAISTVLAQDNAPKTGAEDWPWWRGPNNSGAVTGPAPIEWSETKNVIWKTPVPGRGHASPTVVGKRIFLATADEERNVQSVLCYDRQTGKELWRQDLHQGGFEGRYHKKNTRASSTVACDGERVFASFHNNGHIWLTALDLDGKQLWQTKVGDFVSHWGYSASPALYQGTVIVSTDHKEGGQLVALDRMTGKPIWQTARPKAPTYASPIVLKVGGKDQLLIAGAEQVNSYDPATGKALWSSKGTSTECVSTIISEGDRIFASGGFPAKETVCLRGDGSGQALWRVPVGDFVPSQLVHQGHVYSVLDNGMAMCWKADTGQEMWKERLGSSGFSASPILAGDHIYVPSESGKTHVIRANPKKFEQVAENVLGKEAYASPVICGGRIYLRVVATIDGKRQEMLYCIGQ